MNEFLREFKNLLMYTNDEVDEYLISSNDLAKRLNHFCEFNKDLYSRTELDSFKLRLIRNLLHIIPDVQNQDDKCSIIHSMKTMLKTCAIDDVELFIYLYNRVVYQIFKESKYKFSEEIKLEVLEFVTELIKRSTNRLRQSLYNENYAAPFSMGVHVAACIAVEEKSFKLRVTALDFLLHSMQYYRRDDKVIQNQVGALFMSYLPGLIRKLEEIISRDEVQQHLITVKAISCWGQLLCTVMRDLDNEETMSHEELIKSWMNPRKETNEKEVLFDKKVLTEKVRSKKWLDAAAHSLKPVIEKITEARKHSHKQVRLELVTQIANVIDNCLTSFRTVITPLIEVLISSSEDEEEEIREAADFAIVRFANRCRCKNGQVFIEYLQENLNNIINNKLPHAVLSQNEKSTLNVMQSFCGVLKILNNSNQFREILNFSSNLARFIRVLLIISNLELYPEISAQDYSVEDNDFQAPLWTRSWKRFKYFSDEKIILKLTEIYGLLARISDVKTILDYLFDEFKAGHSSKNEVLFIINEIVGSCPDIDDDTVEHFLDLYLDPNYLYLQFQVDNDNCLNLKESRTNIITVTLLMEGLGMMAKAIGMRFADKLLKSLYVVIEKMGSGYCVIKTAAMQAAAQISMAVGLQGDIRALIHANLDYLTYHITLKLRRNNPGVFDVITVLVKNSSFDSMSNLEEIIINVLKTSSEAFDSPYITSYLRVYQTFLSCLTKWKGYPRDIMDRAEATRPEKNELDLFIEFIHEKQNKKDENEEEEMEDFNENCKPEEEELEEEVEPEEKPKLPKEIELTVRIAENALNYLPSSNPDRKLVALEILIESVLILADRENELLPIVHKIWSPLVTRFEQITDPLLINRSFTLLYVMTRTSKDFIRLRTLKSVLPSLRGFLLKTAEKSKLKDSGSGYYYTQNFKLQKELLSKLGAIAFDLRLTGKELDSLIESCRPYLSSLQPPPLQENCRKLFMSFKDCDPYIVWYKVNFLKDEKEFSKNAEKILQHILT